MQIPTISYFFFIGSGVLLKNVLKDMFPTECDDKSNTWHVIFEGADDYETSTPLSHILDEENDCLLATKMNGENISPDHGYPIRVILPGIAGARNVKWLQSIKVSKKASNSPWNAYYYKEQDLNFVAEAHKMLDKDYRVFYNSWY